MQLMTKDQSFAHFGNCLIYSYTFFFFFWQFKPLTKAEKWDIAVFHFQSIEIIIFFLTKATQTAFSPSYSPKGREE